MSARKVLESLVPVICPPEAMELGLTNDIVDHVELTMGALPPRFRQGFVLGLETYDLAALLWWPGRRRRAHKLPRHLAVRYFERWRHGPTPIHRQLAIAMKQLLSLAHYEQPVIQERMGYRPHEWIETVKRRRLEVYADDVAKHARSLIEPDPLPGVGVGARQRSKQEIA